MRALWELAAASFRRQLRYRVAIVATMVTNVVFGLVRASLLLAAVAGAGGMIAGYDALQASTYVWLGQCLVGVIPMWASSELAQRIKAGDIAVDLLRPVPPAGGWLAAELGRAASALLVRVAPMLALGAITTGLAIPGHAGDWLLGLLSVALAVTLAFQGWLLVNLAALWVLEVRGYLNLYMIVMNLLCGLFVPVSWFPDWLYAITLATPFPSMFQAPINVVLGTGSPWLALGVQLAWVAGLGLATQVVLRRGLTRMVVQGG
ncbi:ABC transporter permease [Micropruina sonneratiae]|uniref:ABC transporter permease n=1 Tax=Micropruina sonneratiae TaxID=2986940 RepID=UPI002225F57F|nr:ABC-2 family transporter protein [Micropruina sp. KQZ13P-5]MCW3157460.1 ABC-2 family transporter protein [Micropruina sp. KQZ13P-5]